MALGEIKSVSLNTGSLGTTTGDTRYVAAPWDTGEWEAVAFGVVPDATLAANATNYATVALKTSGGTTLGSLDSSSTAFTAGTPRWASLSSTGPNTITGRGTAATDALTVAITKAGSGGTFEAEIIVALRRKPKT